MESSARVAVVGMGVIAPGAIGAEAFWRELIEGRPAVADVSRFDTSELRAHKAALVEGFNPRDYIPMMKLRRMNTLSRYGLAATKLALTDGGLDQLEGDGPIGVAIGTTFGPVQTSVEYLREYVEKGAALAPPQLFAESVANAAGSHIAIEFGLRGFNLTFTQRESSAMAAMMYAASQILKGTAAGVVAGGVEEINDITFSVLDRIGALARAEEGLPEAARPFDRRRSGIVVGEGGAVVLLESEERARERGRKIAALVSGFGVARDATSSISDWGIDDGAVVRAMTRALADAELAAEDIDAVWASANGSLRGDRLEARAIRRMFGDAIPPVVATKGYFGEYAAGGALHLCSALLALEHGMLPLTAGFEEPEDDLALPVTRTPGEHRLRHILVNSVSAGGGIISAVLSRGAG